MLRARGQAESYARALPADEGRPPLLLVVDVGQVIELYADFSRSGATYTPFPDPRSHRIRLAELRDAGVRERLRAAWLDPMALDPTRISGRVTRDIAERLARVARSLEAAGHDPERVAGFLSRCLFCFFAEDVGLLPARAFTELLESLAGVRTLSPSRPPRLRLSPRGGGETGAPPPRGEGLGRGQPVAQFVPLVGELWRAMDAGGFSVALRAEVPRFNGKLYKSPDVLPLGAYSSRNHAPRRSAAGCSARRGLRRAVVPHKQAATPQCARRRPALRVETRIGVCGVATLAKGTTLGRASRLASIRSWSQRGA
jgi:hypothetical protein